jgi:hypothetical protein
MKYSNLSLITLIACIALSGCSSKPEKTAAAEITPATPPATAPASQPAAPVTQPTAQPTAQPAAQPASPLPQQAATPAPVAEPPKPAKPPEPKKYVLEAGTPISVRTSSSVSSKAAQSGNEFEATLQSPLVADGHTFAERGATVVGRVVSSDQGGRVKGKSSLTLALSRLHLANGRTVAIQTNSLTQEGKSGTGKNMKRTGVATGAGALIGALAGGGKGAAIGAGIGAGAGVATNLATRGPAAEIPPETVLSFSLAKDLVVTEKR